jgi:hypothetical protein
VCFGSRIKFRIETRELQDRSGITPCSTLASCAIHGVLRGRHRMPVLAADYSALNTLALRPAHELLRARHLASYVAPGLLPAFRFLPCAEPGLLRVQHSRSVLIPDCSVLFPSRFAPFANCSAIDAWLLVFSPERSVLLTSTLSSGPIARYATLCASHRAQIASCATLGLPSPARISLRL